MNSPLLNRHPDDILVRLDSRTVSVATFTGQVAALRQRLPEGRYLINLCEDRYHFMLSFAAAIAAGRTSLLPGNRLPATVRALREDYPDSAELTDDDAAACLEAPPWSGGVPEIARDHLAAIVFTSGSTGAPKPIFKPWRTLVESTVLNARELEVLDRPVELLATVPAQHMYGLETSVLLPWFAPVTISNNRPFFPGDIAGALAAMDAPRILVSTPVHLEALAQAAQALPPIERIWSATAPLRPDLARELERRYHTRVTEIYGCSETGCLARRDAGRELAWQPFDAFSITIQNDAPVVQAAHLPTAVTLQDRLEAVGGGRFRLLGRGEDMVNIAGKRASLAGLNHCLLEINGVVDGVIFQPPARDGNTGRLAALVVAPGLSTRQIATALRQRVDAAFVPRPIRKVDALPRNGTGKLCRQAVCKLFLNADKS